MPSHSAVRITNDLAARYTCIALGAANHKPTCWIDQVRCLLIQPFRRYYFFDEKFSERLAHFFLLHIGGMLRRNHDGRGSHWGKALVLDRDLRFGIGTEPGNFARFAQTRQLPPKFMRKRNRRGHQLRGFIAGKTEHQSLIAGALFRSALSISRSLIDSLFDIAGLLAHFTNHPAGVRVKNAIAVHISDVADSAAHLLLKVKLCIAGYLSGNDDEITFGERFASHAA